MSIEFRAADEKQHALMKEFGEIIGKAFEYIDKHIPHENSFVVAQKLNEAVFWCQNILLNLNIAKERANAVPETAACTVN